MTIKIKRGDDGTWYAHHPAVGYWLPTPFCGPTSAETVRQTLIERNPDATVEEV
jgi:hypothetical protein